MGLDVLEPPALEPVSLADCYEQLRLGAIASYVDDRRLGRLIASARERVEIHTRRALMLQTLRMTMHRAHGWGEAAIGSPSPAGGQRWASNWGFNSWLAAPACIELLRPPLVSVVAVQFYDAANVLRSVDVADYRVITAGLTSRIEFVDGFSFPQTFARDDAASITYTAGYAPSATGDDDDDRARNGVPATIREAILLMVDQAFNARLPAEDVVIDDRIDSMLASFRIPRF